MEGPYGTYVTDGTINATLPKGTEPEEVNLEEALVLLAEKAAKGGGRRGAKKKAAHTSNRRLKTTRSISGP